MGLLSMITRIQDAAGNQLGVVRNDGTRAPIALELGDGLSAVARQNGATDIVRLEAETGSALNTLNVRAAAAGDVTLASASTGQDGLTMVEGDRILLAYQATPLQNGLYVYGTVSAGHAALTRATDFDSSAEAVYGAQIAVGEGTVNGGSIWVHETTGAITIDSTALKFRRSYQRGKVFLTDASQTLTVAGGQHYVMGADVPLTQSRTLTLGTTGARDGMLIAIERTDETGFTLLVVDDAGNVLGASAGPFATHYFKFNATAGHFEADVSQPDTTNYPVFNVRDFGTVGDPQLPSWSAAAECSAIQACIDAAQEFANSLHGTGAVVEFPAGYFDVTGHPIKLRRTKYNNPIAYRGAGKGATYVTNVSGDVFQAETMDDNADINLGGERHHFEHMNVVSGQGYCFIWDLLDAGDSAGDGVRQSFTFHNVFFSASLHPGPSVRLRKSSRTRFLDCVFDVTNSLAGTYGVEIASGSATFINCRGGGGLVRARDGGEIYIHNCRAEGGRDVPALDFYNCNGVVISGLAFEGHDEADAMLRMTSCKNFIIDGAVVANPDRSWIAMRGTQAIIGAPTLTFSHVAAVGVSFVPQNKIVRSVGSWFSDGIGYGSRVRITNAVTNTALYLVIEATHDTLWVAEDVSAETLASATGHGTMFRTDNTWQPTISFNSGTKKITRSAGASSGVGSWKDDGFVEADTIATTSATNPGPFTVFSVNDTEIVVNESVITEGPLTNRLVRTNHLAGGIVLRDCWGGQIRGCAASEFKGSNDTLRYALEIDEDCRDISFDLAGLTTNQNDVFVDSDAYNCTGQFHVISPATWDTLNPGVSKTVCHGTSLSKSIELQGGAIVNIRTTDTGAPSDPVGFYWWRGNAPGGAQDAVGIVYDEDDGDFHVSYFDDAGYTTPVGIHARRLVGPVGNNFSLISRNGQGWRFDYSASTLGDTEVFFINPTLSNQTVLDALARYLKLVTTSSSGIELNAPVCNIVGTGSLGVWLTYSGTVLVEAGGSGTILRKVTPLSSPATGTGISTQRDGQVRRGLHQRTFASTAFAAMGAVSTGYIVLDVLPAKTRIVGCVADTTVPFQGPSVSAATIRIGTSDDDDADILSHDVNTAAVTKGLADGDLGVGLARSTAVQGGHIPSWSATKELRVQLDIVGNTFDHLTQGTIQVTVEVEYLS